MTFLKNNFFLIIKPNYSIKFIAEYLENTDKQN